MNKFILPLLVVLLIPPYTYADYDAGKEKSQVCAGCHGVDGNSQITMYPILAGQYKNYLSNALHAYRSGVGCRLPGGSLYTAPTCPRAAPYTFHGNACPRQR